ncbi:GNAT family N-acetyltransferase [Rhizobium sp. FY34]|uniref:GNAT family N-acetyltransferase n=1 Tax=Rhizobium sp. FY34 TaxID=2562309 RepID=UPI0010C062AF|nr:GNAT family N-acetyltransferase [Rhizobium sp. FY34]
MSHKFSISEYVAPEDEKAVEDRLVAYNVATFGKSDRKSLSILLRDEAGDVEGGLIGHTARGWLYVRLLFIPEHQRGQGLAPKLLALAEDEAKARGCIGAYLDTMNPQALNTYLRCGYAVNGSHGPMTGDLSITWLSKRFDGPEVIQ